MLRRCQIKNVEGGCSTDSKHIVCSQTCQEDYCNSKTNLLTNTGDKQDKSGTLNFPTMGYLANNYLNVFREYFYRKIILKEQ